MNPTESGLRLHAVVSRASPSRVASFFARRVDTSLSVEEDAVGGNNSPPASVTAPVLSSGTEVPGPAHLAALPGSAHWLARHPDSWD